MRKNNFQDLEANIHICSPSNMYKLELFCDVLKEILADFSLYSKKLTDEQRVFFVLFLTILYGLNLN